MKKYCTFLLFIAGLTLCACTSESNNDDGGFDPLSGYNKKFDFSNVDTVLQSVGETMIPTTMVLLPTQLGNCGVKIML